MMVGYLLTEYLSQWIEMALNNQRQQLRLLCEPWSSHPGLWGNSRVPFCAMCLCFDPNVCQGGHGDKATYA